MKTKLSLAVLAAICVTSLSAMSFQTVGYKSVSMGGAGVASSSGSVATYNNPALLAKAPYDMEISTGLGVSIYDHGAGASYTALDDSGFTDLMDAAENLSDLATLSTTTKQSLIDGKDIILNMNGNAVEVSLQAYIAAQVKNFGMGVFGLGDAVATAVVDQTHTRLIFSSGGSYAELSDDGTIDTTVTASDYTNYSLYAAIESGDTYAQVLGVILVEVPVAYGHKFELIGGNLMVGGAAKYMQATTYSETFKIDNSGGTSTNEKNDKTTSNLGVDLGIAFEPFFSNDLTLALVGKNLNSPDFEYASGAIYTISPLVRVGVAYDIFESLEFAADMDLTNNQTFISEVDSKMIGGGLNWHPTSWFALRGGLMKNLDTDDKAGTIYTAGVGVGAKWLQIDLSAQYSPKTTTVAGTDFPQYAKVNLALISRW